MDSSIETNGSCVSRSLRRDLQTMEKEKEGTLWSLTGISSMVWLMIFNRQIQK